MGQEINSVQIREHPKQGGAMQAAMDWQIN